MSTDPFGTFLSIIVTSISLVYLAPHGSVTSIDTVTLGSVRASNALLDFKVLFSIVKSALFGSLRANVKSWGISSGSFPVKVPTTVPIGELSLSVLLLRAISVGAWSAIHKVLFPSIPPANPSSNDTPHDHDPGWSYAL